MWGGWVNRIKEVNQSFRDSTLTIPNTSDKVEGSNARVIAGVPSPGLQFVMEEGADGGETHIIDTPCHDDYTGEVVGSHRTDTYYALEDCGVSKLL